MLATPNKVLSFIGDRAFLYAGRFALCVAMLASVFLLELRGVKNGSKEQERKD